MRIKSLELKNFGSYLGEGNRFDFDTKTGRDGYAIFGEIGRGKTSMINGMIWGLYGHVSAQEVGGASRNRPLIDADTQKLDTSFKQKQISPILNTYAFQEEDYIIKVRIIFENKGKDNKNRVYDLVRISENTVNHPQDDSHMKTTAHLTIDGVVVEAGRIQEKINEVMHEDISKFFFVEGDVIDNYCKLLYAKSGDHSIVEEVEIVLGLPALDKSEEDFDWLHGETEKKLVKAAKDQEKSRKDAKKVEKLDEKLLESQTNYDTLTQQIEHGEDEISRIEEQLSKDTNVAEAQQKKIMNGFSINEKNVLLRSLYNDRRELLSTNLWTCMIQRGLQSAIKMLEGKVIELDSLIQDRANERNKLDDLNRAIVTGDHKCSQCGNTEDGISQKEKEDYARQIVNLKKSIELKDDLINSLGDPKTEQIHLMRFQDSAGHERLNSIEHKIGATIADISKLEKENQKIEKELEAHDVVAIANLMEEKKSLTELGGSLKSLRSDHKKRIDTWEEEKRKLMEKLEGSVDNVEVIEIKRNRDVYKWLSEKFKSAMVGFKEDARTKVELHATDGFLKMVPEPEYYSGIKVDEKWGIVVLDRKKRPMTITNPGHRQLLALSVFNGLRKTSDLVFPTFFDNPGSNISNIEKVADYFWADDIGQMVMLSHGGGLKETETMKTYGKKLARAWRLSYSENSDDPTTSIEVIA
jgi:DNA sulfur modification protein DndD